MCNKLKARVIMFEAKADNKNNESLLADEKLKANSSNNSALDTEGSGTSKNQPVS